MEPKEMRVKLKEAGITCPVSNRDVITKYNEHFSGFEEAKPTDLLVAPEVEKSEISTPKIVTLVSSNIYTYVGQGDEPPHMINFMGRHKFVRGQATEVKDPDIRKKLESHRCFVKGEIDTKILFENDEAAKKKADAQRDEDVKTQIQMDRKNRG